MSTTAFQMIWDADMSSAATACGRTSDPSTPSTLWQGKKRETRAERGCAMARRGSSSTLHTVQVSAQDREHGSALRPRPVRRRFALGRTQARWPLIIRSAAGPCQPASHRFLTPDCHPSCAYRICTSAWQLAAGSWQWGAQSQAAGCSACLTPPYLSPRPQMNLLLKPSTHLASARQTAPCREQGAGRSRAGREHAHPHTHAGAGEHAARRADALQSAFGPARSHSRGTGDGGPNGAGPSLGPSHSHPAVRSTDAGTLVLVTPGP